MNSRIWHGADAASDELWGPAASATDAPSFGPPTGSRLHAEKISAANAAAASLHPVLNRPLAYQPTLMIGSVSCVAAKLMSPIWTPTSRSV